MKNVFVKNIFVKNVFVKSIFVKVIYKTYLCQSKVRTVPHPCQAIKSRSAKKTVSLPGLGGEGRIEGTG